MKAPARYLALAVLLCCSSAAKPARRSLVNFGRLVECSDGPGIVAALSDHTVATILVTRDVALRVTDFAGGQAVVQRDVALLSAGVRPAVLDCNFVLGKIVLRNASVLTLRGLVLLNWRAASSAQQPGMDLLTSLPGELPVLRLQSCYLVYRVCFPQSLADEALRAYKRPQGLPGGPGNTWLPVGASPPGCSNTTNPPPYPLDACYAFAGMYVDVGLWGADLAPNGKPGSNTYITYITDTTYLCPRLVSEECVAQLTPLGCLMYVFAQLDREQAPPSAASPAPPSRGAAPGTKAPGASPDGGGSASDGGGGDGDPNVPAIVLGSVLGVTAVMLISVIAAWVVVSRRQAHARPAAGPKPGPGPAEPSSSEGQAGPSTVAVTLAANPQGAPTGGDTAGVDPSDGAQLTTSPAAAADVAAASGAANGPGGCGGGGGGAVGEFARGGGGADGGTGDGGGGANGGPPVAVVSPPGATSSETLGIGEARRSTLGAGDAAPTDAATAAPADDPRRGVGIGGGGGGGAGEFGPLQSLQVDVAFVCPSSSDAPRTASSPGNPAGRPGSGGGPGSGAGPEAEGGTEGGARAGAGAVALSAWEREAESLLTPWTPIRPDLATVEVVQGLGYHLRRMGTQVPREAGRLAQLAGQLPARKVYEGRYRGQRVAVKLVAADDLLGLGMGMGAGAVAGAERGRAPPPPAPAAAMQPYPQAPPTPQAQAVRPEEEGQRGQGPGREGLAAAGTGSAAAAPAARGQEPAYKHQAAGARCDPGLDPAGPVPDSVQPQPPASGAGASAAIQGGPAAPEAAAGIPAGAAAAPCAAAAAAGAAPAAAAAAEAVEGAASAAVPHADDGGPGSAALGRAGSLAAVARGGPEAAAPLPSSGGGGGGGTGGGGAGGAGGGGGGYDGRWRGALASFATEVSVLGRCSHPNIVRLLAACLSPPRMCLVFEIMEVSLERLVFGRGPHPGAGGDPSALGTVGALLPLPTVMHIAVQVMSALEYLHPCAVHRDLKPANVLINGAGSRYPVAKIGDFGLSRLRLTVAPTLTPEAGTPVYTAPECFDVSNTAVSHHADLYSFAVLLWVLLTGMRPWQGLPIVTVAYTVAVLGHRLPLDPPLLPPCRCPPRLRALMEQCWQADPQRRPAAAEALKELRAVAAEVEAQEPEMGAIPRGEAVPGRAGQLPSGPRSAAVGSGRSDGVGSGATRPVVHMYGSTYSYSCEAGADADATAAHLGPDAGAGSGPGADASRPVLIEGLTIPTQLHVGSGRLWPPPAAADGGSLPASAVADGGSLALLTADSTGAHGGSAASGGCGPGGGRGSGADVEVEAAGAASCGARGAAALISAFFLQSTVAVWPLTALGGVLSVTGVFLARRHVRMWREAEQGRLRNLWRSPEAPYHHTVNGVTTTVQPYNLPLFCLEAPGRPSSDPEGPGYELALGVPLLFAEIGSGAAWEYKAAWESMVLVVQPDCKLLAAAPPLLACSKGLASSSRAPGPGLPVGPGLSPLLASPFSNGAAAPGAGPGPGPGDGDDPDGSDSIADAAAEVEVGLQAVSLTLVRTASDQLPAPSGPFSRTSSGRLMSPSPARMQRASSGCLPPPPPAPLAAPSAALLRGGASPSRRGLGSASLVVGRAASGRLTGSGMGRAGDAAGPNVVSLGRGTVGGGGGGGGGGGNTRGGVVGELLSSIWAAMGNVGGGGGGGGGGGNNAAAAAAAAAAEELEKGGVAAAEGGTSTAVTSRRNSVAVSGVEMATTGAGARMGSRPDSGIAHPVRKVSGLPTDSPV
ncbi:hypothetical protein HYH03_014404 [Edaphochlamys debaryana]|uniref:Protein kinase domain-containing protein n=1 Tax=Edaphochlamys debaryana TaxID=47281 RepID=A0A835XW52_9CHLO|nr:hypothetical protein HYH03_014404 [Edaphochlamys debaryana]|eukprot:KAG2486904.1 hypothetical protein HYH03_014404 [Edaphochlamys debaryana]